MHGENEPWDRDGYIPQAASVRPTPLTIPESIVLGEN